MTVTIALPGSAQVRLEHLLLDVNGTLTRDGRLLDGVAEAVGSLTDALSVRLLSADTFGTANAVAEELGATVEIVQHGEEKRAAVERLGRERCAAIGNGRNDVAMLGDAALGIAVIGPEGACADALAAADMVCYSVLDALALLTEPNRVMATLRA